METKQLKNIVLVHGAFADGSGWKNVYTILKSHGYKVSVVGNPNTGLEDDVAATNRVLNRQDGPAILVGHSYGGAIITAAGDSSKVAGLVYISAFHRMKEKHLVNCSVLFHTILNLAFFLQLTILFGMI